MISLIKASLEDLKLCIDRLFCYTQKDKLLGESQSIEFNQNLKHD